LEAVIRDLDGKTPGSEMRFNLWHTVEPLGSSGTNYWYRLSETEDIGIECHEVFDRCGADIDLKDLSLYARLRFDKDAIHQHETIIRGIRTLLSRWQVKAGNLPTDMPARGMDRSEAVEMSPKEPRH
jgi:hypothetical protein